MEKEHVLKIDRVIGNNVVLAKDGATGQEYVLLGKGIGFNVKGDGRIQAKDPRIEKRFRLDESMPIRHYQSLLEDVDPDVIRISEEIIADISADFAVSVSPKVYLALPSHIQFAVYRLKNAMDIVNPFLYETKMCFPKEYNIAQKAAARISNAFGVEIPEDEIGFLTFHVHAAVSNVSVGQLVKFTSLINDLVQLIETRKSLSIPRESMDYIRLITHLRYAVERVLQGNVAHNPFLATIHKDHRKEYELALEMGRVMGDYLHMEIPDDEIGYMTLHLYRLFQTYVPGGNR
ncbi:PRD domain-containing protein [Gorillibacterium sp. sgz5001074]|uniref:PRD domain-containing protein n=1 Tax=Gorillibacterium sp. sgz5001074 TaxID=3446695 RepID=UPI003F6628CD